MLFRFYKSTLCRDGREQRSFLWCILSFSAIIRSSWYISKSWSTKSSNSLGAIYIFFSNYNIIITFFILNRRKFKSTPTTWFLLLRAKSSKLLITILGLWIYSICDRDIKATNSKIISFLVPIHTWDSSHCIFI
jgi:hypothetical protein